MSVMRERMERKLRPNEQVGRLVCRRCGRLLADDAIEERKQRAECSCGARTYRRSGSEALDLSTVDLGLPPRGAWRRGDFGGVRIGASTASGSMLLMTLFFAVFWIGIAGFFTFAAWASVYMHLTGTQTVLPGWQISKDLPMPPALTVFAVFFLLPFQLVGVAMIWAVLMSLGGRVEMFVGGDTSWVEERFGMLALRTRFRAQDVRAVHLLSTRDSDGRKEAASTIEVWFEGQKTPGKRSRKRFGVPKGRRWWLAAAWQHALLKQQA